MLLRSCDLCDIVLKSCDLCDVIRDHVISAIFILRSCDLGDIMISDVVLVSGNILRFMFLFMILYREVFEVLKFHN